MPDSKLKIEYVKPESLNPAPYNPRKIDEDALRRLAKLLDVHGFVDPVIARRDDMLLIGGHQRLKANELREKPDKLIPCVFVEGIPDSKAKALNIALNNPHAQGQWDYPTLADLLQDIDTGEFDMQDFTAFSEDDIGEIMSMLDEYTGEVTEDEVPAVQEKAISQTGDLWLLGAYWECESCGKKYEYQEGLEIKECPCG